MDDHGLLYAPGQNFLLPTKRHQPGTRRHNTVDSRTFGHDIFSDRYLFSFYYHFHASHPFVLPQPMLNSLAKNLSVQPLLAAMRWIGSLYSASQSTKCFLYDKATSELLNFKRPSDGFLIQATMLLAIGLSGTGKHQKAIDLLQKAKSMAMDIGLNKESQFAIVVDNASMVESWRRTWWELYVLDGLFACAYQTAKFTLCELDADVKLPCEEMEYFTRDIPPRSADGPIEQPSSFACRIFSMQELGKVSNPTFTFESSNLSSTSGKLRAEWRDSLPAYKQDCLLSDGEPDEMMFQAQMISHMKTILFSYAGSKCFFASLCGLSSRRVVEISTEGEYCGSYRRQVLQAAESISELITLRVPIKDHTPFLTYAVILSSMVHLYFWSLEPHGKEDETTKQMLRLNIGALHQLSQVWYSATCAATQIEEAMRHIYEAKKCKAWPVVDGTVGSKLCGHDPDDDNGKYDGDEATE